MKPFQMIFVFLVFAGVTLFSGQALAEEGYTIEKAVQVALERNPELASLKAEVQAADARVQGASLLVQANPELGTSVGRRNTSAGGLVEYDVELSQQVEIFGQRAARIDMATAGHRNAEARLKARRTELAAEVRQVFVRALAADQLVILTQESLTLAQQTVKAAEKKLEAGDGSRIELNTARVEVGRSTRDLKLAGQARMAAIAQLRILLAIDATKDVKLAGDLKAAQVRPLAIEELLARGMQARADLTAAQRALDGANAERRFADRDWLPRPRVGLRYEREEGEQVVLGTLSFDLPVFNRNQAGRGVATAQVTQTERSVEAVERRIRQEVLLAASRLKAAQEATEAFEGDVVHAMEENLSLATTAYQAGKIDLFELLLIRRNTLDARRGYIEALEEVRVAEAELGRALGVEKGTL